MTFNEFALLHELRSRRNVAVSGGPVGTGDLLQIKSAIGEMR